MAKRKTPSTDAPIGPALPDGAWTGWWQYLEDAGSRTKMTLELRWSGSALSGRGKDSDGAFRVAGQFDPGAGEVRFEKRYASPGNDTAVHYNGRIQGKVVAGEVYDAPDAEGAMGEFQLKPAGKARGAGDADAPPYAELARALREALPHLEALREISQKNRKVLNKLPDALYELDYHDDTRLDMDEALGALSERAAERVEDLIARLELLA